MRISRKLEHIQHALATGMSGNQGLQDVKLVPNALPEISLDSISLATRIGELVLSSPIIVNAMTGGAPETEKINGQLAEAARETGIAMAVGSQMAAIRDREMRASYQVVRKLNPDGVIFANLGSEATLEQAQAAVEMLEAQALQLHLNAMQELIMPEGDRNFRGRLERIARIAQELSVPVIVKEVGFGVSRESAQLLKSAGIRLIDVGGVGGTSFAAIENARRTHPIPELDDWGMRTAASLLECSHVFPAHSIIASGGIRTGLEAVKALAIGSGAVGMAGALLRAVYSSGTEGLVRTIRSTQEEIRLVMAALGVSTVSGLHHASLVITGETGEWCRAREVDATAWSRRKPLGKD